MTFSTWATTAAAACGYTAPALVADAWDRHAAEWYADRIEDSMSTPPCLASRTDLLERWQRHTALARAAAVHAAAARAIEVGGNLIPWKDRLEQLDETPPPRAVEDARADLLAWEQVPPTFLT